LPPLDLLRRYEVPIAISTDSNPGTSPATSLLLMMNMATTLFRMTVPEVLQGVTTNAARALGKADTHGALQAGRAADFAVWPVDSLAELAYWIGRPLCARVVRAGETVFSRT
jgi:imidazolonepropionase